MSDAEKKHTQGLRMEAQAVEMGRLSLSQLSAAATITEKIYSAYNQQQPKQPKRVRDQRRNQILMVSGDKGAGKTTLALSLRRWYDQGDVAAEHHSQKLGDLGLSKAEIKDYSREGTTISDNIKKCRKVTWLDVLSLDTMPAGTNLVAAIFARITEAAARENDPNSPFRQDRGLLEPVSLFERALHELGSLRSDAVMALEGNLHRRMEGMDPESYAIAAIESEKKKLEISERLNNVLCRLIERAATRGESEARGLFILPIDDLDSSPARAAEMLSLAYSLSLPRLVFLLMGSTNTLDQILFYQVQGEFRGLLHVEGQADDAALETITATANEIASNSLRKMIPPSQRINLEPLTLEHAARFMPEGGVGSGTSDPPANPDLSLAAFLEAVNFEPKVFYAPATITAPISISLRALLFAEDPFMSILNDKLAPNQDLDDGKKTLPLIRVSRDYIYDGLWLLRSAPRQLADLHSLLLKHKSTRDASKEKIADREEKISHSDLINGLFTESFQPLVDEDGHLTPTVQHTLKNSLEIDPFSGLVELTPPDLSMVTATGDCLQFPSHPFGVPVSSTYPSRQVVAHRVRSLELESRIQGNRPRRLSPATRSAFKIIHDLIRFTGDGVITKLISHDDRNALAFTQWSDGVNHPFNVPWFSTDWLTFWHTDFFFRLWNHGLLRVRQVSRDKSSLFISDLPYLMTVIAAAALVTTASSLANPDGWCDENLERELEGLLSPRHLKPESWDLTSLNVAGAKTSIAKMAVYLAEHAGKRRSNGEEDDQTDQIDAALVNLVLLLAPECGVVSGKEGNEFAQEFGTFLTNSYVSEKLAPRVRRLRLERLGIHASTYLGMALLNPALVRAIAAETEVDPGVCLVIDQLQKHYGCFGQLGEDGKPNQYSELYCPMDQDLFHFFLQSERTQSNTGIHAAERTSLRSYFVAKRPKVLGCPDSKGISQNTDSGTES